MPLRRPPDTGETLSDYFAFEEIFARVLGTADHELAASSKFLFWSGLAAGLALGLTFLAKVIFTHHAGEASPGILGNLLYPIGFIVIVIGRYQLFTENTLTPVALVLTKLASLANLLRLWLVVFAANMIGAMIDAAIVAYAEVLETDALNVAVEMGHHALGTSWLGLFSKALIAGGVVASMVWLIHAARDTMARITIVWMLMYFIGVGGFFHVVTSSVEVFFLAFRGETSFWALWPQFILPVFLGNTLGGIGFVAIVNYVQFGELESSSSLQRYGDRLTWREWIFGRSRVFGDERARVE
ncbi:formate/nitrite transporter family protein [Aureimonas sp. SA4125]|uniref:formate/nitrite transporter family protein n=1 Tax=Aureimonas sp. SA4125 TaxID=2826993 RepID=UPI001CC4EF31|nr:formate/nitrite transporter family protein [Aureimonas sp. SA4125]